MDAYFYLADRRILLWLNHGLAQDPHWYRLALLSVDKLADVLTLATLLWLWFWPAPQERTMMAPVKLPPREGPQAGGGKLAGFSLRWRRPAPLMAPRPALRLTRLDSRAQMLVFMAAGMSAYLAARLIALTVDVPRPFNTYLPIRGIPGAFEDLRLYGSFPSDHAALLGALPLALFHWNRRLAWAWVTLALVLGVLRIAVGFHYPSDMLAGAALGVLFAGTAMYLYDHRELVHDLANMGARGFELANSPYCYILYFFLAVIGLEFAMHFKHVLDFLYEARGEILYRLRGS